MAAVNGERGGLKVIIVGAGIGGLSTAAFLRQQGHAVDVRRDPAMLSATDPPRSMNPAGSQQS
jgi:glycine/D-amino acid oxidase-like deaminating enzyme